MSQSQTETLPPVKIEPREITVKQLAINAGVHKQAIATIIRTRQITYSKGGGMTNGNAKGLGPAAQTEIVEALGLTAIQPQASPTASH